MYNKIRLKKLKTNNNQNRHTSSTAGLSLAETDYRF
jgi:hypothetical protein